MNRITMLTLTFGVAVAGWLMVPGRQPAQAFEATSSSRVDLASTELSAQKKRWRKTAGYRAYQGDPTRSPYYLRPGVAPSFGYIGPPGYAGEYAWRRSIGQCVEDLGYGRWSACGAR